MAELLTVQEWQRPHPLTLGAELVSVLPAVLFLFILFQGGGGSADPSVLLDAGFILLPLCGAVARYLSTRYAVMPDAIHYQRGVIFRRKQMMPRSNVQNVSSNAPLLARMVGLAEVKISDASSEGNIDIRFLDSAGAAELIESLRVHRPPAETWSGPHTAAVQPNSRLVAITRRAHVARAELARVVIWTVWLLLALLAAALLQSTLSSLDLGFSFTGRGVWFLAIPILLLLVGSAQNAASNMDFTLSVDEENLDTRQGVLTEVRHSAVRSRLQLARVHDDFLLRIQGLERVSYDTADAARGAATLYLSPATSRGDWRNLVSAALDAEAAAEPALSPVDKVTIRRMMFRFAVLSIVPLLFIVASPIAAVAGCLATNGFGYWYSVRRWENLGFAVGPTYLVATTGVFARRRWIVRLDKVQGVHTHSTWFQRRLGVSSLSLGCAGTSPPLTLPDLDEAVASNGLDYLARRSATTPLGRTV